MAAYTGPRASIHASVQVSFSEGQAYENTRDGWGQKKYSDKNAEPDTLHYYDFTRKGLNFAIDNGKIKPLRKGDKENLLNKYYDRLTALDYKPYKADAEIQPKSYVDWVIGGDRDTLRKLAFGDQTVDYNIKDHAVDNSHVRRMPGIENFAKDVYDFACKKFGEENVIGLEVHLDETTPHIHINTIPVAPRKTRGRASYLYVNKTNPADIKTSAEWKKLSSAKRRDYIKTEQQDREAKESVSFSGKFGETRAARRAYLKQFHTAFFEEVGSKYGLARGNERETLSDLEQQELKHMTPAELEAFRLQKMAQVKEAMQLADILNEKNSKSELKILEKENRLDELDGEIKEKETEGAKLDAEIDKKTIISSNLDKEIADKKDESDTLDVLNQIKKNDAAELDKRCQKAEEKIKELNDTIHKLWPEAAHKSQGLAESLAWNAVCNELRRARQEITNLKPSMSFAEREGAEQIEKALFDDEHRLKDLTDSGAHIVVVARELFLGNVEMAMSYAQTSGGGGGGSESGWGRKKDEDDFHFMQRCFLSACSMMKPPAQMRGIRR